MSLPENEAKIRRAIIKNSVIRLNCFLNSPRAKLATKFELIERKKKLASLFQQYDEVQSRIECLMTNTIDNMMAHAENRARFEEVYFRLVALYDQRLNSFEQLNVRIQLPSFAGSYED